MLKKTMALVLCAMTMASTASADDVNMSLAELSGRASQAVVGYYKSDLKLKINSKSVTDIQLISVESNTIEMSAIAPTPDQNDGIPYYCEITLKRKDSNSSYVLSAVGCSKYD